MAIDGEKLLTAQINDLYVRCGKYASAVFSRFYNAAEQVMAREKALNSNGYTNVWFGGYDGSERNILGIFNEWEVPDNSLFPIAALKAERGGGKVLSHRDYLGAVLSLGIDRNRIGDILVDDSGAVLFVTEDIAGYIKNNITKIGSCGVKMSVEEISKIKLPERKFKIIETVAAAERIDAVLAAALGLPRSAAAKLVQTGKVQLNHRICGEVSKGVCEGDLISVRGFGRLLFEKTGNVTRSGRLHITLKKYI